MDDLNGGLSEKKSVKIPLVVLSRLKTVGKSTTEKKISSSSDKSYSEDGSSGSDFAEDYADEEISDSSDSDVPLISLKSSKTPKTRDNVSVKRKNIFEKDQNDNCEENNSVNASKCIRKKNSCIYCKKLYINLARHLIQVHGDEEDVKKFSSLPSGSSNRKKIIELIRKNGNFRLHSRKQQIIPVRNSKCRKSKDTYIVCPYCRGFYQKRSASTHISKCNRENYKKHDRTLMVQGRRLLLKDHPVASQTLKSLILPKLRPDEVTKKVLNDRVIISFGNKLAKKYSHVRNYKMIRSNLRLLGRLLFKLQEINNDINELCDIFHPKHYRILLIVVNEMSDLSNNETLYRKPVVALSVGTILKKVARFLRTFFIENFMEDRIKDLKSFIHLLDEDYATSVNKCAVESLSELKRNKKISLPTKEDIIRLYKFLCDSRRQLYNKIKQEFTEKNWRQLASYILTSLQVYNRRRAGEIEQMTIEDFENFQTINDNNDTEILESLNRDLKDAASSYVRVVIRGKLSRNVSVLIDTESFDCLKYLITHRERAGIDESNPFVFAVPTTDKENNHLSACKLLREFSVICGAKNPESLRGTLLRKHLATRSAILNLKDSEVSELANFMGHAEKIHSQYYKLPIAAREITHINKILSDSVGTTLTNDGPEPIATTSHCSPVHSESSLIEPNDCSMAPSQSQSSSEPEANSCGTFASLQTESYTEPEINKSKNIKPLRYASDGDLKNVLSSSSIIPSTLSDSGESHDPIFGARRKCIKNIWSTPQKEKIRSVFAKYLISGKSPPLKKCKQAVKKCPELNEKSVDQVYSFVSQEIRTRRKKSASDCTSLFSAKDENDRIVRKRWSTPEKVLVDRLFGKYIENLQLPRYLDCKAATANYVEFENRTSKQLYAYVNNQIQKAKTQYQAQAARRQLFA